MEKWKISNRWVFPRFSVYIHKQSSMKITIDFCVSIFFCFNGLCFFLNTHRRYSINMFLFYSFITGLDADCFFRNFIDDCTDACIKVHVYVQDIPYIDVNYTLGRQFNLNHVIASSRKLSTQMALPPNKFEFISVHAIQVRSHYSDLFYRLNDNGRLG